jgi:hypothetical protein
MGGWNVGGLRAEDSGGTTWRWCEVYGKEAVKFGAGKLLSC